jgi:hypothetical protein
MMVFHGGIGDQEQCLDAIESMLKRSVVVVIGFANCSAGSFLVIQLLRRASNENKVTRRQAAQNMLDCTAANATRSKEDSDFVLRHGLGGNGLEDGCGGM